MQTMGTNDITASPPLHTLLSRADVIIPCTGARGLSESSVHSVLWQGVFQAPRCPLFLVPAEYAAETGGGADGGEGRRAQVASDEVRTDTNARLEPEISNPIHWFKPETLNPNPKSSVFEP